MPTLAARHKNLIALQLNNLITAPHQNHFAQRQNLTKALCSRSTAAAARLRDAMRGPVLQAFRAPPGIPADAAAYLKAGRDDYMAALEAASVGQDVAPFAEFVGGLVQDALAGRPAAPVPGGAPA